VYKLWSSSLRSLIQPPTTSSLLGPNVLSILFSHVLNLFFSFCERPSLTPVQNNRYNSHCIKETTLTNASHSLTQFQHRILGPCKMALVSLSWQNVRTVAILVINSRKLNGRNMEWTSMARSSCPVSRKCIQCLKVITWNRHTDSHMQGTSNDLWGFRTLKLSSIKLLERDVK
jgi:hypothetical protein